MFDFLDSTISMDSRYHCMDSIYPWIPWYPLSPWISIGSMIDSMVDMDSMESADSMISMHCMISFQYSFDFPYLPFKEGPAACPEWGPSSLPKPGCPDSISSKIWINDSTARSFWIGRLPSILEKGGGASNIWVLTKVVGFATNHCFFRISIVITAPVAEKWRGAQIQGGLASLQN